VANEHRFDAAPTAELHHQLQAAAGRLLQVDDAACAGRKLVQERGSVLQEGVPRRLQVKKIHVNQACIIRLKQHLFNGDGAAMI